MRFTFFFWCMLLLLSLGSALCFSLKRSFLSRSSAARENGPTYFAFHYSSFHPTVFTLFTPYPGHTHTHERARTHLLTVSARTSLRLRIKCARLGRSGERFVAFLPRCLRRDGAGSERKAASSQRDIRPGHVQDFPVVRARFQTPRPLHLHPSAL